MQCVLKILHQVRFGERVKSYAEGNVCQMLLQQFLFTNTCLHSGHHHPIGEVIVTFISRLYYVGNLAIFFTLTNKITWANGSKIKSEP
jgi:hypothetical protein